MFICFQISYTFIRKKNDFIKTSHSCTRIQYIYFDRVTRYMKVGKTSRMYSTSNRQNFFLLRCFGGDNDPRTKIYCSGDDPAVGAGDQPRRCRGRRRHHRLHHQHRVLLQRDEGHGALRGLFLLPDPVRAGGGDGSRAASLHTRLSAPERASATRRYHTK